MNYKIALSAAFITAGLAGCDSRNVAYDRTGDVGSGTTTAAPIDTTASDTTSSADLSDGLHNSRLGSGVDEKAEIRDTNEAREARMRDRKVAPTYSESERAEVAAPAPVSSGATSDEALEDDFAENYDLDEDFMTEDDNVMSGTTAEPSDDTKASYSRTDVSGGLDQDRNLRFGLIGNGTGMGLEDTTSKFMTDNYTLSDPTIDNRAMVNSGALSAPTDDQDALKDIKSGTSFDPENYYIEDAD